MQPFCLVLQYKSVCVFIIISIVVIIIFLKVNGVSSINQIAIQLWTNMVSFNNFNYGELMQKISKIHNYISTVTDIDLVYCPL